MCIRDRLCGVMATKAVLNIAFTAGGITGMLGFVCICLAAVSYTHLDVYKRQALREEVEYYRNRKLSGRQKHNAKWMAIYNDFVVGYESCMTMVEIAKLNNVSERTIYRYKAYYDKMREDVYKRQM